MRIGVGYDVHRFEQGRPLVLGGVKIEYKTGLKGHSDADVLIHAIMDAIIGALGMGDIGELFPDSNEEYKDISSLILLEKVKQVLDNEKYRINNIDTTIIAQEPKMIHYKQQMKINICRVLDIATNKVNIKATTTEGLGFEGRKEGIAAFAVVIVS